MPVKLYNTMEGVVKGALQDIMAQKNDFCKCEECQIDIMAIALNSLPAKYVGTHKGEVYSKIATLSNQFNTDAYREIVKAIAVVNEKPRHEK